ncbi:alpha/beta-hydrolase [Cubamyces menziesii]|nr:alpha/beta-hydrolase [Cubamyces menziesii]
MQSKPYVFDARPTFPLLVTARQYWTSDCSRDDPDAVTLVFAHATGFHKEHWEPTLEHLLAHLRDQGSFKVRDAWCIDAPNHGEAAKLNERTLQWGYVPEEYARAVHLFLAGLGKGVDVDFSSRKLVGIGHSMGATAIILSHTYQPPLPYVSVVLVDPMLLPSWVDSSPSNGGTRNILLEGAEKRRDIWPSREEAWQQFTSRPAWKIWDERVLKLYVQHGLRELPTAEYPDRTEGVTLTYTKAQETACYRDKLGRTKAYRYLPYLCDVLPVHFIWGEMPDPILTAEVKNTVMSEGTQGKHASEKRIKGAGHLLPQMQPERLAAALTSTLVSISTCVIHRHPGSVASRL